MRTSPSPSPASSFPVTLTDDEGTEVTRHVVGVGAMLAGEERTFHLSVEVTPTNDMRKPAKPAKRGLRH